MIDKLLHNQVTRFIDENKNSMLPRSTWIKGHYTNLYIRYGKKYIGNDTSYQAITIASIVVDLEYQRKGIFKGLVDHIKSILKSDECVYVECVNNPILRHYLESNNFLEVLNVTFCYYWKP